MTFADRVGTVIDLVGMVRKGERSGLKLDHIFPQPSLL